MLHTWQNAAYLGYLNFEKKLEKSLENSLEKVKMTVILENDR